MTRQEIAAHFRLYGAIVYRRALVLLGDAYLAEKATLDVLVQTMKERDQAPQQGPKAPWIYRVTTNRCLELMREQHVRRKLLAETSAGTEEHFPIVGVPGQANMVLLRGLLCEADEQQARAAAYIYSDGLVQEEAAALLSISKKVVGVLLEQFNRWARARIAERARDADVKRDASTLE